MVKTVPMKWLIAAQGVHGLEDGEFDAIRDFTLLWGLFEGRVMGTRGSQNKGVAAVDRMVLPDPLPGAFASALAFWRGSYWENGAPTASFDALHFAKNQHRADTLTVLNGCSDDPVEVTKAMLQITMRLRNNLFHGVKWQYACKTNSRTSTTPTPCSWQRPTSRHQRPDAYMNTPKVSTDRCARTSLADGNLHPPP